VASWWRPDDLLATDELIGRAQRDSIVRALPAGWSWEGKRVLDFGCGHGRTLRQFIEEPQRAELWGCDIDEPSIRWLEHNLCPPLSVLSHGEEPPLPLESGSFDLIWALSVFTHLTDGWSSWLLELRRLLKPDGLLLASFNAEGWSFVLDRAPWHDDYDEDQVGMHVLGAGNPWELGGPGVFHSEWWLRAHWGRAFEVLRLDPAGFGFTDPRYGQGLAVLRPHAGVLTPADLERPEEGEPRELAAARYSLRQTQREAAALRKHMGATQESTPGHSPSTGRTTGRRGPAPTETAPEAGGLAEELTRPPPWLYSWDFGELGRPELLGSELPSIHQTRLEMIEGPVREALEGAGETATAIDLGCAEGWFSHRLLELGASRVVGVDRRGQCIHRATLVRDHLGIPADRLSFVHADLFGPEVAALGDFDVVLLLGLVYQLEDPVGAMRRAHALTRRLCMIESQLTRAEEPIRHGMGRTDDFEEATASFAAVPPGQSLTGEAVPRGEEAMALVPNRTALEVGAHAVGFGRVAWRRPAGHHNEQFRLGDRGILSAWKVPAGGESWIELAPVTGRIHPNDDMLYSHDIWGEHYAAVSRSAVERMEEVLALAGRSFSDVLSCLDMPCGYGRVLRLLRERIDPERITACDVTAEAVAFCASEFGARPLLSDPEFEGVPFETYDLIWVGSLITHLDERLFGRFCTLLTEILAPGGVLVITTLGEYGMSDVSVYEPRLAAMQEQLQAELGRRGFAFVPYEDRTADLGYAWHTPDFLEAALNAAFGGSIETLAAIPRGWDNHQDLFGFRRTD
jgi:SAM-dependent methyltransferase